MAARKPNQPRYRTVVNIRRRFRSDRNVYSPYIFQRSPPLDNKTARTELTTKLINQTLTANRFVCRVRRNFVAYNRAISKRPFRYTRLHSEQATAIVQCKRSFDYDFGKCVPRRPHPPFKREFRRIWPIVAACCVIRSVGRIWKPVGVQIPITTSETFDPNVDDRFAAVYSPPPASKLTTKRFQVRVNASELAARNIVQLSGPGSRELGTNFRAIGRDEAFLNRKKNRSFFSANLIPCSDGNKRLIAPFIRPAFPFRR